MSEIALSNVLKAFSIDYRSIDTQIILSIRDYLTFQLKHKITFQLLEMIIVMILSLARSSTSQSLKCTILIYHSEPDQYYLI